MSTYFHGLEPKLKMTLVGGLRTDPIIAILGAPRFRRTASANFMIEHALIGQLKTYPVYMDDLWSLEQGEIQKVTKPGEKQ